MCKITSVNVVVDFDFIDFMHILRFYHLNYIYQEHLLVPYKIDHNMVDIQSNRPINSYSKETKVGET